jgi:GNAT superfamily N-acetyltransferase
VPTHPPIEVVEYDDRWAVAQTAFAARCWPGKGRRGDPTYLRWEYRADEVGPVPGLLLAVSGDEVVGQLGMIPGEAQVGERRLPIQWIGNLMVDPDHRRRGISTAIFERALDRPVVTLGRDPSPSAAPMMETVGFSRADSSDLMVLPLSAGEVVGTRYPGLARWSRALDVVGAPVLRRLQRALRDAQSDPTAQVCTWRDVVDDVAASEAATSRPHAVHDEAFLRWRCAGLPPWVREVDAVRTARGSFALLERRSAELAVLHWHAVDVGEVAPLMGRVVYLAGAYGAAYVEAVAVDAEQVEALASLGFRARRTPIDLWCHPAGAVGGDRFAVQGYDTDQNL